MLLILSLKNYSQTTILSKTGDTLFCFTQPQAKFLLKQAYRVLQLDTTLKVCQAVNLNFEEDLRLANAMITNQQQQLFNRQEVLGLKDYEIDNLKAQVKKGQKEVRRQKVFKWIAIGVGGAVSGVLGVAYLKK